jgi:hypothetical protein
VEDFPDEERNCLRRALWSRLRYAIVHVRCSLSLSVSLPFRRYHCFVRVGGRDGASAPEFD